MTAAQFRELAKEKRSEHDEQVEVNAYCLKNNILMFAIPNGSYKSQRSANLFRAEGLKAGVPDLFIPIASKNYHGLFIEMKQRARTLKNAKKSLSHTKVSPAQLKWLETLNKQGFLSVVCYGADEAIKTIEEYLK